MTVAQNLRSFIRLYFETDLVILGEKILGRSGVLGYKDKVVENNKSNWPKTNLRERGKRRTQKNYFFKAHPHLL